MEPILARCGFRCDLCMAYSPNIVAHPENAPKLSDGWFKYFGFRIPAEKINCPGCLSNSAETLDIGCPVRPCVVARGLETCASCEDYACGKLQERLVTFEDMQTKAGSPIPEDDHMNFIFPYENKVLLDALRASKNQS
jgi:hypothetical protein